MCKKPSFDVAAARERALAAMTVELAFNQRFPEDKKEPTRSYSIGKNGKVTIVIGDATKAQEENQLLGLPVREDPSMPLPDVVFGRLGKKVTLDMVMEAAKDQLKLRRKT